MIDISSRHANSVYKDIKFFSYDVTSQYANSPHDLDQQAI